MKKEIALYRRICEAANRVKNPGNAPIMEGIKKAAKVILIESLFDDFDTGELDFSHDHRTMDTRKDVKGEPKQKPTCPKCKGRGTIDIPYTDAKTGKRMIATATCPECKGANSEEDIFSGKDKSGLSVARSDEFFDARGGNIDDDYAFLREELEESAGKKDTKACVEAKEA